MNRKLVSLAILAAVSFGAQAQNTWNDWAPPVRSSTALPPLPGLPAPSFNTPTIAVEPPPRIVFDERGAFRPPSRDFDDRDGYHRRQRDFNDRHHHYYGGPMWERNRYGDDAGRRFQTLPAPGLQPIAPPRPMTVPGYPSVSPIAPPPGRSGGSSIPLPFANPLPPNQPISATRAPMYNMLGMNHESQVAAECVATYGTTYAGAGCITGRLTLEELNKCFSHGVGGRGCFGDNNTLVNMVKGNFEAAKREKTAADQAIRATTGISVRDIKDHGILGGNNSDARKACNAVAGLFGGKC